MNYLTFSAGVLLVAVAAVATFALIAGLAWNDWGFNASELFHAQDLTFWQATVVGTFVMLIRLRLNTSDEKGT